MKHQHSKSFFAQHQKLLKTCAIAYALLVLLSHWQFPVESVWLIAAVFSILMNFTYLIEALSVKRFAVIEATVTIVLIGASLLGLFFSPLLLIAAIFGHGCWDLTKHFFERGVPFYFWYTCSCFLFDTAYSIVLLVFWFSV